MKKITLALVLTICALITFGQTPWTVPQFLGGTKSFVTVPGGFKASNGIVIGTFADTTALNLTGAKFYESMYADVAGVLHRRTNNVWVPASGGSTDTTSLSNRINLKVNISDTATMLSNYAKTAAVNLKVNISDTAAMLTPYITEVEARQAIEDSITVLNIATGLILSGDTLSVKIASSSDTGAITPAMKAKYDQEVWIIAISDQSTALTTGTGKFTFRVPYSATVTGVRASLKTESSSGIPTFDINENGTTILSTKLTIDANEKTSTTAAAAAVISDTSLADDAEITIDIDVAGTGAIGGVIYIYHTKN